MKKSISAISILLLGLTIAITGCNSNSNSNTKPTSVSELTKDHQEIQDNSGLISAKIPSNFSYDGDGINGRPSIAISQNLSSFISSKFNSPGIVIISSTTPLNSDFFFEGCEHNSEADKTGKIGNLDAAIFGGIDCGESGNINKLLYISADSKNSKYIYLLLADNKSNDGSDQTLNIIRNTVEIATDSRENDSLANTNTTQIEDEFGVILGKLPSGWEYDGKAKNIGDRKVATLSISPSVDEFNSSIETPGLLASVSLIDISNNLTPNCQKGEAGDTDLDGIPGRFQLYIDCGNENNQYVMRFYAEKVVRLEDRDQRYYYNILIQNQIENKKISDEVFSDLRKSIEFKQ